MANESKQLTSLGNLFGKKELELLAVADLLAQELGAASRDDVPALDREMSPTRLRSTSRSDALPEAVRNPSPVS